MRTYSIILLGLLGAGGGAGALHAADEPLRYNRDVRAILSDRCFACHGPDENKRGAGLRLDQFDTATAELPDGERGRHAIVPGDPKASELVQRIFHSDPDSVMPPPDSNLSLSPEEKAVLVRWINEGAVYEKHWSFVRPEKESLPEVAPADWPIQPLDYFVLQRLEEAGLSPAEEADRRTLLRRVHLDLTGLPPTPEEIHRFLADEAPGAYERVVDRLLASPHFGERMALPWLDAARYADTHGYQDDQYRNMWPYRDWVINAFNANQPFDQFTIEQLAGDLLPEATDDQFIASGFNRNHRVNNEGGVIAEEYRVEYVADRTETTGTVWMGLTMNCTRCHDHKYDPLSQEDYYSLFAYFNSVPERGLDGKGPIAEPSHAFRADGWEEQHALYEQQLAEAESTHRQLQQEARGRFDEWYGQFDGQLDSLVPSQDLIVHESYAELSEIQRVNGVTGPSFRIGEGEPVVLGAAEPGSAGDFERDQAFSVSTWVRLDQKPGESQTLVARMDDANAARGWDLMVDKEGRLIAHLVHAWPTNAVKVVSEKPVVSPDTWVQVGFRYDGSSKAAGLTLYAEGRAVPTKVDKDGLADTIRAEVPTTVGRRSEGFAATAATIGAVRLYDRAVEAPEWALFSELVPGRLQAQVRTVRIQRTSRGHIGLAEVKVFANGENVALAGKASQSSSIRGGTAERAIDNDTNPVINLKSVALTGRRTTTPYWEVRLAEPVSVDKIEVFNSTGDYRNGIKGAAVVLLDDFGRELWRESIGVVFDHSEFVPEVVDLKEALSRTPDAWKPQEQDALFAVYARAFESQVARQAEQVAAAGEALRNHERAFIKTMVMKDMPTPRQAYVLDRGVYDGADKDRPVYPRPPEVLEVPAGELPANRLGLARWLVHPDHPLTPRVTVNRFWQEFFGTGLVATPEDFGLQGAWPSHPELLDWLSRDFVDSGWDMKGLIRQLVTSATYRQAAVSTDEKLEVDPFNHLLSRGPRFRMRAQLIRDQALAASGLLMDEIGGPSVKPYQPPGLWAEVSFGGNRSTDRYQQDAGEKLYRRGLYTFWKRTLNPPGPSSFDAASREFCVVSMPRTNTPLQALNLMNDPTYLEAARKLAERMLKEGGDRVEDRIAFAHETLLATRITDSALAILTQGITDYREALANDPAGVDALLAAGESPVDPDLDRTELAAYSLAASVLLNLDPAVTRP